MGEEGKRVISRAALEHIIRAAAEITKEKEFIIIGAASLLGEWPDAPRELRITAEADIYPRNHPEKSKDIDGAIGELSAFHNTHGFYAHGVGPETATLPKGWERRLFKVCNQNTDQATGFCLDVHDLAISKLAAGREKDFEFIRILCKHRIVKRSVLGQRIQEVEVWDSKQKAEALQRIEGLCRSKS